MTSPRRPEHASATLTSDLGSAPTIASGSSPGQETLASPAPRWEPVTHAQRDSTAPTVHTEVLDISATAGGDRYERVDMLGSGGMGEVWLHRDRRIGRRVAVKTLKGDGDGEVGRERFLREVRVQGQLEHPSIVPVYDLDVDPEGRVFFTMKRVRGDTLERIIGAVASENPKYTKKYGQRKLLQAFAQVCLTIDYAHTRGVLHRDLKPGNVMLGDFGEVYVLDWGLAKLMGEPDLLASSAELKEQLEGLTGVSDDAPPLSTRTREATPVLDSSGSLTINGVLLGTPAYMSPEQLADVGENLDARSDIYSLGVILFEILTHTRLRSEVNFGQLLLAVSEGRKMRPSERTKDVPPELDELCVRALDRDPDARPKSARELAETVERYLDGDRDLLLRRELAARHVASAEKRKDLPTTADRTPRLEAMREVMKALALDADNAAAQRLIVELVVGASDEVPVAARPELAQADDAQRADGAKWGAFGLISWLMMFPVAIVIGVRSWPQVLVTAASTIFGALYCYLLWRRKRYGIPATTTVTAICAIVTASVSCYLGPFALVSTVAATTSLLTAMHFTKRERVIGVVLTVLGAAAPFAIEALALLPGAYVFEAGRIIVPERAIALPRGATMFVMFYATVTFAIMTSVVIGRVRDSLRASERRLFLQAWHLRQLFPGAASG